MLTMHAIGWERTGEELAWMTGRVNLYEVRGLSDEKAFIANIGAWNQMHWRIMRVIDGIQGEWAGDFATADMALATLVRWCVERSQQRVNQ
jgi:hypothetical protein